MSINSIPIYLSANCVDSSGFGFGGVLMCGPGWAEPTPSDFQLTVKKAGAKLHFPAALLATVGWLNQSLSSLGKKLVGRQAAAP